ncbi:MAG: glycosyltransferase family 39 protein [Endomicrobia bacterium]|nr:glycosyltransferase family 39 protein [Endomicrobiia bacterium]
MKIQKFYLSIILIFSIFGLFGKLSIAELQPLGSAAHAAISREILRTGDWLTLHWPYCEEFSDFYQFPPLFFWLQAFCFKIFGISDTTAKFVSSFFGVLVIIATFFLAKILTDNDYIGFLSAMSIILHPYFFKHARKCELETGLIFFITVGIIFFILSEKKNKPEYLILSGLSAGLGFLYKGPPAYAVQATILISYLINRQFKKIFNIYFILSFLISISIPLIWIIPQFIYKGNAVIEKFFVNQILWSLQGRSVKYVSLIEKIKNYLFFIPVFFSYYLPWSITGLFGVHNIFKEKKSIFYTILIWCAVVWAGFTLAGYKDDYYLLAFWPGWCSINGYIFSMWTKNSKEILTKIFLYLSVTFALIVIFTPIKFDKIRNPEFKNLAEFVKSTVPKDKKILTYNLFYYDMVALIPWYWDKGVIKSTLPNPTKPKDAKAWKEHSVDTEQELYSLIQNDINFILIKKQDYENLSKHIKKNIKILKEEGRFYFCQSIIDS